MTIQDELLALRSPLTGRFTPAGVVHWASQHPDSKLHAALDWSGAHQSRERHVKMLWIHFGLPGPLPGWEHESLRDLVTSNVADGYMIAFDANEREVPLDELVKLTDDEFNKCTASLAPGKVDGRKD
jgi:hypothetical protein